MKRVVTFGRHADSKPQGMLREVIFPKLADLDKGTKEGMISRILSSEGADSRSLPRTIYFQFKQAPGHDESVAVGMVDEVFVDGENGNLSGKGWLIDNDKGREAALYILTQSLYTNSVDLAEVKVHYEEHGNWFDDDFTVDIVFDEWKFGATTFVGKPAFADAHGVLPDEITAALEDDSPLVLEASWNPTITLELEPTVDEVVAGAGPLPSWDYFHIPEAAEPQKITVGEPDEHGFVPVSGHLSLWNSCHDGYEGRCVITPRPTDNYASFNKPGVLTDRGMVETGPIALRGGHTPLSKALDDVTNAWCDVRVVAGVHGPWVSGVVRPGVSDEDLYAARASRISGHWKQGRLKAIVSVNAEGFDVPGSGFSFATNANGEVVDLVASFPGCSDSPQPVTVPGFLQSLTELTEPQRLKLLAMFTNPNSTASSSASLTITTDPVPEPTASGPSDEDLALALALELDAN